MSKSRTSSEMRERGTTGGLLVVMTGPSGCGKSTIVTRLFGQDPGLALSVSHTTRKARPKEVEGKDYYFVDDAAFDRLVAGGGFAEWAPVHKRRYGTSRREIDRLLADGKDIVLDVDVQGADQLADAYPDAVTVFILPPSMRALEERLRQRGTESPEQIAVRLGNARSEIAHSARFQYIVVNESIDQAVAEFHAIIRAERRRGRRVAAFTERLLTEDDPS